MSINLNNYEEWIIDYLDGNLDDQKSKELKAFLLKHPPIAEEFEELSHIKLFPDQNISLDQSYKFNLKKQDILPTEHISENNYEHRFIAFHEEDLEEEEKNELKSFLSLNEFLKPEFKAFSQIKLQSDLSINYPHKDNLHKKEKKLIPLWIWPGVAAAILIIGFWIGENNTPNRPHFSALKINSKSIQSIAINQENKTIPFKSADLQPDETLYSIESTPYNRSEPPQKLASLSMTKLETDHNKWPSQMEFMQALAFERSQLDSQVNWSVLPSENSKKGFNLISAFLWKTTKTGVQSFGEEVFKNDIQILTSNNIETLSGGNISIKRPTKETE